MTLAALLLTGTLIAPRPADNVIVVTLDGMRWQEVFGGADARIMDGPISGVKDPAAMRKAWWRADRAERRRLLMPFLWEVVAKRGTFYGDREAGSQARVTNGFDFSYPGYNEMMSGFPDPRVDSNADRPNPNDTVWAWLNRQPGLENRVAVFGSWNVVSNIVAKKRTGLRAWTGVEPVDQGKVTDRERLLNDLKAELHHPWYPEPYDAITFESAFEYLKANRPRALWISFGETDDFAHEGRYDEYLEGAHRNDGFIQKLWDWVESTPGYKGRTTLILTPDHGRGNDDEGDWRNHGAKNPGSDQVWSAVMGPGLGSGGVATNGEVRLGQIAASIAAALGLDYVRAEPRAMPPLPVFTASSR